MMIRSMMSLWMGIALVGLSGCSETEPVSPGQPTMTPHSPGERGALAIDLGLDLSWPKPPTDESNIGGDVDGGGALITVSAVALVDEGGLHF